MNATINPLSMDDERSEALFASALQPSDDPGAAQVRRTVTEVVRRVGVRGCAERVAQEFGDHPELAVARMRWARGLVAAAFGPVSPVVRRTFTLPVAATVAQATVAHAA
jgi:hypothetical protein